MCCEITVNRLLTYQPINMLHRVGLHASMWSNSTKSNITDSYWRDSFRPVDFLFSVIRILRIRKYSWPANNRKQKTSLDFATPYNLALYYVQPTVPVYALAYVNYSRHWNCWQTQICKFILRLHFIGKLSKITWTHLTDLLLKPLFVLSTLKRAETKMSHLPSSSSVVSSLLLLQLRHAWTIYTVAECLRCYGEAWLATDERRGACQQSVGCCLLQLQPTPWHPSITHRCQQLHCNLRAQTCTSQCRQRSTHDINSVCTMTWIWQNNLTVLTVPTVLTLLTHAIFPQPSHLQRGAVAFLDP